MNCPKCQTVSPQGNRFCGACGATLDPTVDPLRNTLETSLRAQLHAELNERLRAQNPAAQARRHALWMSVPSLALLLVALFFGLRSYHNVTAQLESARQDLDGRITQLRNEKDAAERAHVKRSESPLNHYDEGEAWGGAFWKLRGILGKDTDEPRVWRADRMLYAAWATMKPGDMKIDRGRGFVRQLLAQHAATPGDVPAGKIRAVFERRGLKL